MEHSIELWIAIIAICLLGAIAVYANWISPPFDADREGREKKEKEEWRKLCFRSPMIAYSRLKGMGWFERRAFLKRVNGHMDIKEAS